MPSTYYSSSSSSSSVSTPSGSRSAKVSRVERDGKGALRRQKEKNGTIVKDELVLFDKEGMHPAVLGFFADEIEKQAVLTPTSALKAMQSKNRIVRGAGRLGAEVQQVAGHGTPGMASTVATYPEPAFMVGALKGETLRGIGRQISPHLKNNPVVQKATNVASELGTYIERNVPTIPGLTDLAQQGAGAVKAYFMR